MTKEEINDLLEALNQAFKIVTDAAARLDGVPQKSAEVRVDPRIAALEATERRKLQ
jgi:hypothetical protein